MIALIIGLVVCAAGAFQRGLWSPDEPREAEIGREMLASRWSAVPTLSGEPFLEKPPLFAWTMAASYAAFGVSAWAARVPAVLFSLGAVAAAYLLGRRCGGRLAGLCAAAVLVTCEEFAVTSHRALLDTALTFFVAVGHLALLDARDAVRLGRPTRGFLVAGACAGLAFLTKGVVGPALVAAPTLLAATACRDWGRLRRAVPRIVGWCALFVITLGGSWAYLLSRTAGWHAVNECLVRNTVGRALGGDTEEVGFLVHGNPWWFYLRTLPAVLAPWTLAVPALVVSGVLAERFRDGRTRHLAFAVVAGVLLLSIPAGKRPLYLVPLLPAAAAVFGVWLSRVGSTHGGRWDRATSFGLLVALAFAASGAAYVLGGGPLPAGKSSVKLHEMIEHGRALSIATSWACVAAALLVAWVVVRSRAAVASVVAARATCGILLAYVAWHVVGAELLDPIEDLEPGAATIASLVPSDEPLLALDPDETTRAALTFRSRRALRRVGIASTAEALLAAGPARHLVVMESSDRKIDDRLRRALRLVATVRLNVDRRVLVYEWIGT